MRPAPSPAPSTPPVAGGSRGLAIASLIGAALLWSSGGFFIKSLPLSPLTIAGARSAIAACVLAFWLRSPKPTWSRAQIGGAVSYALTVVLFVTATKWTTAANAILLQYTAPIWVALGSAAITRERIGRTDILTIGAVIIGMVVFFVDKVEGGSVVGNLLAVSSGVAFAGVALCMRAQRGVSTVETILLGNILAAVVCLPFVEPFVLTVDVGWRLIALGVLQLGVSYILYARALAHVTALEAVLYTTLEPLLNPVWVAILLGERPSGYAAVGGSIVIVSIVLRQIFTLRTSRSAVAP